MNNVIDLIKKDMQKHKVVVKLPNEKKEKELYLILITAETSKFGDFKKTYGSKATATHLKLAKKIFRDSEMENVYGVLVDKNLHMVFAFNRDFADYNRKRKLIVYKDIDDVLIDKIEIKKIEVIPTKRPEKVDLFPRRLGPIGLIKYSLDEKKS